MPIKQVNIVKIYLLKKKNDNYKEILSKNISVKINIIIMRRGEQDVIDMRYDYKSQNKQSKDNERR